MTKEELNLVKQVQSGDESAFNLLFNRYYFKAYAIAYRIMNCDADAHDAAQETMLEVYHSIDRLKEPNYFYAWMIRIVISKCNRIYRKQKEMSTDPYRMQETQTYQEKRVYLLPDQVNDNQVDKEILVGLIYSLKPQYAQVLDLMYLHQLKLHEIADRLDVSINTIKSRIVRGRVLLKERICEFERYENRRISFHARMPLSLLGFTYFVYMGKFSFKKGLEQISAYASGGVLQTACVISFSLLAVSGGVLISEELTQNPSVLRQAEWNDSEEIQASTQHQETMVGGNHFKPVLYQGDMITTSIDAYYTCLNFAWDQEEMQKKTQDELDAIQPVYISLKEKQDIYSERLREKGWVVAYEALNF